MSVKRSLSGADTISRKKPRTGSKKGKRVNNPNAPIKSTEERLRFIQDESWKDDEARELEGLVFGKAFAGNDDEVMLADNDEPVQLGFEFSSGAGELGHLEDNDLFVLDGADAILPSTHDGESEEDEDANRSERGSSRSGDDEATPPPQPTLPKPKSRAAWHDPSDLASSATLAPAAPSARLRKLRHAPDENIADLSTKEYESRLRAQFKRIHGEASWVSKARAKARGTGEEDASEASDALAGVVLRPRTRRGDGKLQVRRLHDVLSGDGQGEIKSVVFHPSERVSVLAVGSSDRRVRLYGVSSTAPPTLVQTLHIPSLPLSSSESLAFSPSGREMLMSSDRRGFAWLWDLEGGRVTRRELSAPASVLDEGFNRHKRPREGSGVSFPSFSPTGSLLSLATEGTICLYDWRNTGSGRSQGTLVSSFKPGTAKGDGGIAGVRWVGENTLSVLLSSSTVLLYDTRNTARSTLSSTPCVSKWTDEGGGFRGSARCLGTSAGLGDGAAGWLGVGSSSGLINLYSPSSLGEAMSAGSPKPLKTIESLTTPVSLLRFNSDASMLALASKGTSGKTSVGMRLFNTNSLTTYSNWPTSATPLGRVTAVDFSRRGNGQEYLAVGNVRGRVTLWSIEQFPLELSPVTPLDITTMHTTDRLLLRAYEDDDKRDILALYNDPSVARFISLDDLVPRDAAYFDTHIRPLNAGCLFYAVIVTREPANAPKLNPNRDGAGPLVHNAVFAELEPEPRTFVGEVSLSLTGRTAKNRDVTLHIAIRQGMQGRGYGAEVLRWLVDYTFRALGMHRMSLGVFESNVGAYRIYKRLGFVEEGRLREAVRTPEGTWDDLIHMGILEDEWRMRREDRSNARV
ncbi:uncharacterized protein SCHCODRAFT_02558044 [Schizophyllum commune H4-8]|nr:uncharacterized protein SCHCODRAFT_02558044 [Schizophyllum commune H4-8]KAI5885055.1 hypothetical protein SCHCODRAFT_02558044 [Schizophyllum commune H4-8]